MKSRRLYICGLMSLMLHAALVAGLLLRLEPKSATLVEAPDKPVRVELVMEEQKGAGETQTRPPAPKPAARQPAPTPPTPRKEAEPVPAQPPVGGGLELTGQTPGDIERDQAEVRRILAAVGAERADGKIGRQEGRPLAMVAFITDVDIPWLDAED